MDTSSNNDPENFQGEADDITFHNSNSLIRGTHFKGNQLKNTKVSNESTKSKFQKNKNSKMGATHGAHKALKQLKKYFASNTDPVQLDGLNIVKIDPHQKPEKLVNVPQINKGSGHLNSSPGQFKYDLSPDMSVDQYLDRKKDMLRMKTSSSPLSKLNFLKGSPNQVLKNVTILSRAQLHKKARNMASQMNSSRSRSVRDLRRSQSDRKNMRMKILLLNKLSTDMQSCKQMNYSPGTNKKKPLGMKTSSLANLGSQTPLLTSKFTFKANSSSVNLSNCKHKGSPGSKLAGGYFLQASSTNPLRVREQLISNTSGKYRSRIAFSSSNIGSAKHKSAHKHKGYKGSFEAQQRLKKSRNLFNLKAEDLKRPTNGGQAGKSRSKQSKFNGTNSSISSMLKHQNLISPHLMGNKFIERHLMKNSSLSKFRTSQSGTHFQPNLFQKKSENETLVKELTKINRENVALHEQMEDLTLKNSSLKHELDHSHGLKKENTQLREELKITQLQMQDLETRLVSSRLRIQELLLKAEETAQEKQDLEKLNEDLKHSLKTFSLNLKDALQSKEYLLDRIKVLSGDFNQFRTNFLESFRTASCTMEMLNKCFTFNDKGEAERGGLMNQGVDNVLKIKQNLRKLGYTMNSSPSNLKSKTNKFNFQADADKNFHVFNQAKGSPFNQAKKDRGGKLFDAGLGKEEGFITLEVGSFGTKEMREMVILFRKVIRVILDLGKKAEKIVDYGGFEHHFE